MAATTTRDEAELEWWRRVFACRFQADNLPRPGTALYGHRLTLMVREPDGTEIPWTAPANFEKEAD